MSHPSLARLCLGLALTSVALASTACEHGMPAPKMSSSSSSNEGLATCPAGSSVVGGGFEIDPKLRAAGRPPTVVANRPTETGWKVECVDAEGKTITGCRAFVLCASLL